MQYIPYVALALALSASAAASAGARDLEWSGHTWWVRTSEGQAQGPGPNIFSDSEDLVFTDEDGRLHLRTRVNSDGTGYSVEVDSTKPLGYGVYTFCLDSPVTGFDEQTVFGAFLYDSNTEELDIEHTKAWGDKAGWYVVQPGSKPGNKHTFVASLEAQTCHRIDWRPERVIFSSWNGHAPKPARNTLIAEWVYEGPDIPPPDEALWIFNLWFSDGIPAEKEDEVAIKSFSFVPYTHKAFITLAKR